MEYAEALEALERHINYPTWGQGVIRAGATHGLGLERMEKLVEVLGQPQSAYPVIHVTGTNGKGSTARVVTRLLQACGLTVGTYTSPHLERYNERIRVNDEDVSDEAFASAIATVTRVEPMLDEPPSHFELLTAAALTHFADIAVDVAVVEVGLLGRFDATNVVDADVAVVTNVGRDHTDFEGDWRRRIAEEKAGIIKERSRLVLGPVGSRLEEVFLAERPADVWHHGRDFDCDSNALAVGGRLVTLRTPFHQVPELFLPLHGAHQGENAATALAAAEAFFGRPLADDVIHEAFEQVTMPGRFEVVQRNPLVVLDGAHNPDGAEAAARVLAEEFTVDGRRTLVVGILTGRDPAEMLRGLGASEFDRVICVTAPSPRGLPSDELAAAARGLGLNAEPAPSIEAGLGWAYAGAKPPDLIFVSGSLYLVGTARSLLVARR
ncbi:MAG: dihydrofolate synthase / folylpolyglutamate synthase [Acidimicrobiia bacterium]|nr:dihydrofolate synthase / folylpolyglutamate synthase [Acidimicrobiia bacterium]